MKTVWKFGSWALAELDDVLETKAPISAKFLTAGNQGGRLCLWALVDPEETERRIFLVRVAGTGHELDGSEGRFLNSVQFNGGALVFHVFVREQP